MARPAVALGAVLLALVPADASAARQPWATVNVCDTVKHPNAIGIRASMPGAKRRRVRLHMRFRVQWRDPADNLWHNLVAGGDSGFVAVGRARRRARRQAGQLFRFEAPPGGRTQLLRGRVDFQWRIRRRVVRHEVEITEGGHRSAAGGDPPEYSAATCTLQAP